MNDLAAMGVPAVEDGEDPDVTGNLFEHELGAAIVTELRTVYDPEIPVNIYDLGLIYNVDISPENDVHVDMTLTAPGCPVAGEMPGMVARAIERVEGVNKIDVEIVWEPPWTDARMTEVARLHLDMF